MSTKPRDPYGRAIYAQLDRFGQERIETVINAFKGTPFRARVALGLGSRETLLQNIVGGGYFDEKKVWHTTGRDRGVFQISDDYHHEWLTTHKGCKSGYYLPEPGHNASEVDYVPTLEDSLEWVIDHLTGAAEYAAEHKVPKRDQERFAIASHNAGYGGALQGYQEGNVDLHTTGKDYSADVIRRGLWSYRYIIAH